MHNNSDRIDNYGLPDYHGTGAVIENMRSHEHVGSGEDVDDYDDQDDNWTYDSNFKKRTGYDSGFDNPDSKVLFFCYIVISLTNNLFIFRKIEVIIAAVSVDK